jgi:hypothetical protein
MVTTRPGSAGPERRPVDETSAAAASAMTNPATTSHPPAGMIARRGRSGAATSSGWASEIGSILESGGGDSRCLWDSLRRASVSLTSASSGPASSSFRNRLSCSCASWRAPDRSPLLAKARISSRATLVSSRSRLYRRRQWSTAARLSPCSAALIASVSSALHTRLASRSRST